MKKNTVKEEKSTKNDPLKQIETRFRRVNPFSIVSSGVVLAFFVVSLVFFWPSYIRLWESVRYFGSNLLVFFKTIFGIESGNVPATPPNSSAGGGYSIPADIAQFFYLFKTFSLALFNRDMMIENLFAIFAFILRLTRVLIWVPYSVFIVWGLKKLVLSEKPQDQKGETHRLVWFKKVEKKKFVPVKNWINSFWDYWRHHKVFKSLMVVIVLNIYHVVPIAIDLIGWYFGFTATLDIKSFGGVITSAFVDLFIVVYKESKSVLIVAIIFFVSWLRKKSGWDQLHVMQEYNEGIAKGLPIASIAEGPVGVGKTFMLTSIGIDMEMQMRGQSFDIIKKYGLMFPDFPWDALEEYLETRALGLSEDEKLVNRAQIAQDMRNRWQAFKNDGNAEPLFGYDVKHYEVEYFDGIKWVPLVDALEAYAQAYFLYWADKPLAFANYSINFKYQREGYFPTYDYDYIAMDKRDWGKTDQKYFAHWADFDARRILNHVNNSGDYYVMDGQVEIYTEMDKERGNQFDQAGQEKTAVEANQKNDGWNRSVKVTRHEFTIDGIPFTRLLLDLQREASLNIDLVETCEDKIIVKKRSDINITLPFFFIDYAICHPLIEWWNKYIYEFRKLRKDKTLYNYLIRKIVVFFSNHYVRRLNEFGYNEISFIQRTGASADGDVEKTKQIYYGIIQKMYSKTYRTDCYSAFFEFVRLAAKKGFLDAKQFADVLASPDELKAMNSYWINELMKFNMINEAKTLAAALLKDKTEKSPEGEKPAEKPAPATVGKENAKTIFDILQKKKETEGTHE